MSPFSDPKALAALGLVALLAVTGAGSASGQLKVLESDDLRIVYPGAGFEYLVPHISRSAQNAVAFHRRLYDWNPSEKITIFLEDFSDYGHGGATTVPSNFIVIGVAPFNYVYDTIPAIDRIFWMANHEVAHIVTMDQAAGSDGGFRKLFGGKVDPIAENPLSIFYNFLTNPRWNAPRWYHEGIAVFLETWMAGGLGRVLGGYDEMVFRSMVLDESHFYDVVGLESEGTTIDFQVGVNAYLYGTRFMSYLAYRHGPEKLVEWSGRPPGSRAYFSRQFERVFGASLDDEWARWIEFERDWQRKNLESIRRNPVTEVEQISATALGSVSRTFLDAREGKLYVAIRYPGQLAHLAALDLETGDLEALTDIKGAAIFYVTSLAWDPDGRTLFYTSDNYGWRDLNAFDLATGKRRRLMKDARVGDLAFNRADRSLWGVRHYNGISTLVRIPHPYEEWNQIHSWPYGEDLYEIDVSPDGAFLTGALAEVDGTQSLIRLGVPEIMSGEVEAETLYDFGNSSPSNFVFSEDGRYLFGSSYYSGVSNLYRYDFGESDIDILTNAETGLFRPAPLDADSLIAYRYTGAGLVPVTLPIALPEKVGAIRFLGSAIVDEHPVVRQWKAGSPKAVDEGDLPVDEGDYRSLSKIRLNSFYPVVEGFKDSVALGFRLNLADPLNLSGASLTLSYSGKDDSRAGGPASTSDEELHFTLDFHHWDWEARARYNGADFYDLFGPTKTGRKGYSLGLGYNKTLLFDEPRALRLEADVDGYGDLETLPEYQNVAATSDELLSARVLLGYEHVRKSLGAVDEEKGVRWQLVARSNWANSTSSPRLHATLDYGIPLPLDHSSIWLRGAAGQGFGRADDPFAQFFFGAFGNNYVDRLSEKRYREYYSFPGVEINQIGGRNFAKLLAEWTLPPLRFRRVGKGWLYLNWARLAFFGSVLETNLGEDAAGRTFYNLGAQLDFKLVLFSNLSSTLSLGYAVAEERNGIEDEEFMISLKIL